MMKTTPFWWEDSGHPPRPESALPPLPKAADAIVIGAGHTGLSAARTLALGGRSVVLLEAEAPAFGASGRNGGMIGGGHRLSVAALTERFGARTALGMLREAHVASLDHALSLIADEGLDVDLQPCGRFRGLWQAEEYDRAGRELDALQKIVPIDAWMVPEADQQREVATPIYAGGTVFARHSALNPAKFALGMLGAVRRHGVQVFGETPVTRMRRRAAPGAGRPALWRIETPRGTIEAPQVLVATNGYSTAAMPWHRRRVVPVPSFILATEPIGADAVRALFPSGRMVAETRERHCYYRPSPCGTRVIFGGRAAMFEAPRGLIEHEIRKLLTEVFPALAGVGLSHLWTGRTGFSFDLLPNVGNRDGLWHAMGYSGSGNAMAPWLGHKAAQGMLGLPGASTAFSASPFSSRAWHPGPAWFLPFADLTFRLRDLRSNARRRRDRRAMAKTAPGQELHP